MARSLDYETERSFSITVMAVDNPGGSEDDRRNPMSGVINITVTDVNDNPPVFTHSIYERTVAETVENFMLNVSATDEDSGQFIMYMH